MRINLDSISMYGMRGRNGKTTVHLRLGDQIVKLGVQVYPSFDYEEIIFDQRIIDGVQDILDRRSVKKKMKYLADNNISDYDPKSLILSKSPDYKKGKIPPIRFY